MRKFSSVSHPNRFPDENSHQFLILIDSQTKYTKILIKIDSQLLPNEIQIQITSKYTKIKGNLIKIDSHFAIILLPLRHHSHSFHHHFANIPPLFFLSPFCLHFTIIHLHFAFSLPSFCLHFTTISCHFHYHSMPLPHHHFASIFTIISPSFIHFTIIHLHFTSILPSFHHHFVSIFTIILSYKKSIVGI